MVFLGLTYDTVQLTVEVPQDKLHTTLELIRHWLAPSPFSKSDLQSLFGKLSYIFACISPGRIFMQRLLQELRQLPHKSTRFKPSSDMLSDLPVVGQIPPCLQWCFTLALRSLARL